MDISPKCFSIMTNNDDDEPGVIIIRTKDSNKILHLRLPDSNSFSQWQIMLSDAIANVISIDAIKLQPTGRVSSSKIISALTICNLLTSTNNPAIIRLKTSLRMRHLMSEIIQRLNLSPHLVSQNEVQDLIIEADNHIILRNDVDLSFLKAINERIYDKEALAAISFEIQMEESNDPITYGWTAATIAAIEDKDTMIINELSEKEKLLNAELSDITAAFATISDNAVDVEVPIISTETIETVANITETNITSPSAFNSKENSQENKEPKAFVPTVIASLSPFSFTSPFGRKKIVEIDDKHVTPVSMNPSIDTNLFETNNDPAPIPVEISLSVPLLPALRDSNKPKLVSDKSVTFNLDKENKKEVTSKESNNVRRPLSNISNTLDNNEQMRSKKKSPISAPSHAKRKVIVSPTNTMTSNNETIVQQLSLSEPASSSNINNLIQFYQEKSNSTKTITTTIPCTTTTINDVMIINEKSDKSEKSSDKLKEKSYSKDKVITNKVIYVAVTIAIISIIITSLSLTYTLTTARTKSLDETLYFKDGKLDLEKVQFTKKIYDSIPIDVPKDIRQESAILATLKTYDSNVPIQKKETIDKG